MRDRPTPSETKVRAVIEQIEGWKSATFAWHGDPDPEVAECNKIAAIEAHAAECLRRIRIVLADGVPEASAPAPDEVLETLIEDSGGYWKEDVFCVEGGDLMNLLRAASASGVRVDGPADIEALARATDCTHVDLNGDRAKALERLAAFAAAVRASGVTAAPAPTDDRHEQKLWLNELFTLIETWNSVRDGTPYKAEAWNALWKHAQNIGPGWRARAHVSGVAEAPKPERYSWTVDGMEHDENGAWVRSDATGLELLKSANRRRNAGVRVDAPAQPLPASDPRVSTLRWLLNITTEFDRKDVRTRQAARLLDEFSGGDGRTNRELLEDLWAHVSGVPEDRAKTVSDEPPMPDGGPR